MSYTFMGTRGPRIPPEEKPKRRPRGSAPKKVRDPSLAPLRRVIGHIQIEAGYSEGSRLMLYYTHELLECFHHQMQKEDIYGPTNADRRRCRRCLQEEKLFKTEFARLAKW